MSIVEPDKRERASHIWARETHEHYVEEPIVSKRLFDEESFEGEIFDPCCGFGHIVESARAAGHPAYGYDLVDRGYVGALSGQDFLAPEPRAKRDNIVMNPPFDVSREFILRALEAATWKVASIYPTRRLNAASWLEKTSLCRILYITPRPSMPPGHVYKALQEAGKRPSGGTMDFCWLDLPPRLPWRPDSRLASSGRSGLMSTRRALDPIRRDVLGAANMRRAENQRLKITTGE